MKLLLLSHTINGGGAERVAVNLANGLSKLGWKVVLLTNHSNHKEYKLNEDIKVKWFNNNKNRLFRSFYIIKQLIKTINNEKPNVIIEIQHVYPHEFLLACQLSRWKCPIIISEHNSFERPSSAPMSTYTYYQKFILNRFYDYVTVLTQTDKEVIGNRLRNVKVMYNPLSFKPLSEIPKKEKIVLAVGRIDAWHVKGFDILIKSWNNINKIHPDWKLKIIGAGSNKNINFLKNLITEKESVIISGFTPNILEEYKRASIFCLSSRYEGWGLVMVEAMSQGCAVVACDYKGRQSECITTSVDGVICSTEDSEELAEEINRLIENSALRKKIQENALKRSQRFYKNDIVNEWNEFLLSVTKLKNQTSF